MAPSLGPSQGDLPAAPELEQKQKPEPEPGPEPEDEPGRRWRVTLARPATEPELVRECYRIRVSVFVDEQGFKLEDEFDGKDPESIHLLVSPAAAAAPEEYVGTLRLHLPTLLLGRVAVLGPYRGSGAARALLSGLEPALRGLAAAGEPGLAAAATGEAVVECHSQLHARGLYRKLGYEVKGDGAVFDEDGAPHQALVKKIRLRGGARSNDLAAPCWA